MLNFFKKHRVEPLRIRSLEDRWDSEVMGEAYKEFNDRMSDKISEQFPHLQHYFK